MEEKEAGYGILNDLPGAKGNDKPKDKDKPQTEAKPKQEAEAEPWLSIWNDALFREV